MTERAATVRERGTGALVEATLDRWLTRGFRGQRPDVVQRVRDDLLATDPEGYAGCCEALARLDLRDDLARVEAAALVVAGAQDESATPGSVRELADGVPRARFEVVPAKHLASVEQAPVVTELLMAHLT